MRSLVLLVFIMVLSSCNNPVARRPITQKSGHFLKQSIERNKVLQAQQEALIQALIKQDSTHKYYTSSYGFWYKYNTENTTDSITPDFGDEVSINYDISTLKGRPIYTRKEIGTRLNLIEKEGLFSGLRHGLKLMKAGETVTFYFPSFMAFGYYGDNNKIGRNVPIRVTATLNSITQH